LVIHGFVDLLAAQLSLWMVIEQDRRRPDKAPGENAGLRRSRSLTTGFGPTDPTGPGANRWENSTVEDLLRTRIAMPRECIQTWTATPISPQRFHGTPTDSPGFIAMFAGPPAQVALII
jgi:hypothetical protein